MKVELLVLYCLFKEIGWILPKKSCWASPDLTPLNSAESHTVLVTARASDWSHLSCHSQETTWVGVCHISVTNSSICISFPDALPSLVAWGCLFQLQLCVSSFVPQPPLSWTKGQQTNVCHWCFSFLHNSRQKMGVLKHWTQTQEFTHRRRKLRQGRFWWVCQLPFLKGCPTMKSLLCSATVPLACLGPCGWSSSPGSQVVSSPAHSSPHSDWRMLPGRELVYSSPPPFPVPSQVRLIQQTSNGKKKKVY